VILKPPGGGAPHDVTMFDRCFAACCCCSSATALAFWAMLPSGERRVGGAAAAVAAADASNHDFEFDAAAALVAAGAAANSKPAFSMLGYVCVRTFIGDKEEICTGRVRDLLQQRRGRVGGGANAYAASARHAPDKHCGVRTRVVRAAITHMYCRFVSTIKQISINARGLGFQGLKRGPFPISPQPLRLNRYMTKGVDK
jgi:hypothetical protein